MSDLPSWARRGAKVVCVRDFGRARIVDDMGFRALPEVGKTYTISRAVIDPDYRLPVVYLQGFPDLQGFDLRGFRPAVEPKSEAEDVAMFRDLIRQPHPVEA